MTGVAQINPPSLNEEGFLLLGPRIQVLALKGWVPVFWGPFLKVGHRWGLEEFGTDKGEPDQLLFEFRFVVRMRRKVAITRDEIFMGSDHTL